MKSAHSNRFWCSNKCINLDQFYYARMSIYRWSPNFVLRGFFCKIWWKPVTQNKPRKRFCNDVMSELKYRSLLLHHKSGLLLPHWGQVMHICVGNLTIIVSDNGLSPGRRQAITWTNVGILLIGPLGTIFSEMLIEIHTFSFMKIHLNMSSGKWRPFCLGFNVLSKYYGSIRL